MVESCDESISSNVRVSSQTDIEVEPKNEWRGVSMDDIYNNHGPFGYQEYPPIVSSDSHTVLFKLPIDKQGALETSPVYPTDNWDGVNWVKMPYSSRSIYPFNLKERIEHGSRLRWEVIIEALQKKIVSSAQLEAAIFSYNYKHAKNWDFRALHHLFSKVMEKDETVMFFDNLLPKMIQLALQLPSLIVGSIPLLKKFTNKSLSMSQLQIASLLANAFFCTFPNYRKYPNINFNRLFSAYNEEKAQRSSAVSEKFRCLFNYFQRVTTVAPEGTVTYERRWIPIENCPDWKELSHQLPQLHITSKGTIESEGMGLLQVDFANKKVGGGVLNYGCVQEEIRFAICPELFITRLITDVLEETEALVITGAERYSSYEGYGNYFKWAGNFVDNTPRDNFGRRKTSIVAMDALRFTQPRTQFTVKNITRELNKAYVGFHSGNVEENNLPAVATGNWGCGAFRGNARLKAFIQLMAAAVNKRSMVYFTFGDPQLCDSVGEMFSRLIEKNITIGNLYSILCKYEPESMKKQSDFYGFLFEQIEML